MAATSIELSQWRVLRRPGLKLSLQTSSIGLCMLDVENEVKHVTIGAENTHATRILQRLIPKIKTQDT